MKLKKLNTDHYIIVDDSEIKEGDWYYWEVTKTIQIAKLDSLNRLPKSSDGSKKITHSTQPLEIIKGIGENSSMNYYYGTDQLFLQEVKELIGEVDVEKKAINSWEGCDSCDTNDELFFINGYQRGYKQALEDNKEKKYTEEDVIRIVEKSRETGLTAEYLLLSLQPKTEWEVEFIDGKLTLKQ